MSLLQESLDTALKCYITQIYNVQNASRVELLLDLLEGLVEYNVVPAKYVITLKTNSLKVVYPT